MSSLNPVAPSATLASPATPLVLTGRLVATPKGFAFLPANDGLPDVFLPPNALSGALHGESVEVTVEKVTHDGRRSGRVTRVLEGPIPTVIGRLTVTSQGPTLVPLDARFPTLFLDGPTEASSPLSPLNLPEGSYLQAQLVARAQGARPARGEVVQAWGDTLTASSVAGLAAASRGFSAGFSEAAQAEAALLGDSLKPTDFQGRNDLRHLPWVTIDGESTRDFDDALAAEPLPDGWRLWVAIADVAHYVRPGTALDIDARARGTSVYLPGLVLPMLPEALSNGLCSLNPGVDRLALVAELTFNAQGERIASTFHAGVLHSKGRLTYTGVSDWLDQGGELPGVNAQRPAVEACVRHLDALYAQLDVQRSLRGALDFDAAEPILKIGANGKVDTVVNGVRTRAHKLVEETMIAANVAAAEQVGAWGHPAPYRNHGTPCPRRFAAVRSHAARSGIDVPEAHALPVRGLSDLVQQQPDLAPFVRNAQIKASYTPVSEGHFGLGLADYAHFTSPIRRYPDLLVHRALWTGLGHPDVPEFDSNESLAALAAHLSERESSATSAEREATDRLRMAWLSEQPPSQTWKGTISGATGTGLFVTLDACGGSGFLPAPEGSKFDDTHLRWVAGEQEWTLGTGVEVHLVAVEPNAMRITLGWGAPAPALKRPGL